MRPINKVIIHCSATPEGRDVKTETIKEWHTAKGWSDIGYHYVIELDCLGQNKFSIGICYVGGMNKSMSKPKDTRTEEQKVSLTELINELKSKFDLSVHGHNQFSNKACPSFDVENEGY